jgi:hypothetical protein|tara:strand:- start:1411 stop:1785 length:375 start_codon:yes stop_codon:yes gene_type:complete
MKRNKQKGSLGLLILIAVIQIFDIIIHIATSQIEPIRVIASTVLLIAIAVPRLTESRRIIWALGLSGKYLLLNVLFVLEDGFTHAGTGEPRVLLVLIVLSTTLLGVLYARSLSHRKDKSRALPY